MEIRGRCAWACPRKTEARWALRALAACVAIVVLWPNLAAPLLAQTENGERRANHHPIEVPESTDELAQDIGVRAHTTHLILLRPERIHQARAETPVGETPGSLACVYQTSSASLSSGCPISGNLTSGNNGLPNPSGGSQTIAIVDAYDYPTAYNDLTVFSNQFGLPVLPQCSSTSASGCFQTVFASGTRPASNGSWALEEALDIEWAHAMSPQARIVLVEASSSSLTALFQAVAVASQLVTENAGSGEVSMSWGGGEFSAETTYDSVFTDRKSVV